MAKKTDEQAKSTINLAVQVQRHVVDKDLLEKFANAKLARNPEAQGSLTEYIEQTFEKYKGKQVVVVPDLSNGHFEGMDLSGLDFTGCKLSGANFQFCKLEGAIFADCDLSGVTFNDCEMQKADMRGADLSGCQFGLVGEGWDKTPEATRAKFKGMKFSSTEGLLAGYLEKNNQIQSESEQAFEQRKAEKLEAQQEKINAKQVEINAAYKKLSWLETPYVLAGQKSGNKEYDKLVEDQQKLKAEKDRMEAEEYFAGNTKYVVSPSLVHVMGAQKDFDPAYVRGSSKQEREQEKQYVRMTREDAESYLKALKTNPDLQINDFAKTLMSKKGMKEVAGARIIADFSSRKLENGKVEQVNLSGLDFTGAHMQRACFSGANMKDCNFTGADLSQAVFESANISGAKFINTTARDTNFFYCDMSSASIASNSDFRRAFMRGSDGTGAIVKDSNFNYANIRHGKWDDASISDSQFNYTNLEGISLAGADLRRVSMQHSILDKAIMEGVEMAKVDLQGSMMNDVIATNAKIKDSILKDIEARRIDLTDAELDKLCTLEGADLQRAIMTRVEADGVNFQKARLEQADLTFASLREANLEKVNARFAKLEGAVVDSCKATEIDISGADLSNIHATKAEFTGAIAKDMVATKAVFDDAVMESMDLRGADLSSALMERVNLRKADLRNAELEKAKAKGADVSGAKVNEGTNLAGADVENVKGKMEHHNLQGDAHEMAASDKVKNDEQVQAAKQKNKTLAGIGNALKGVGGFVEKGGEYVRQPFGAKWGRVIGAFAGAVLLGGLAASAVFTAGASLVVMAAIIGGAGLLGAGTGAVAGHYAAKKMTILDVAAGVAGAGMGGPIGVGIGIAAAKGIDGVVKSATGKTATEHLASGVENLGAALKQAGENVGLSQEEQMKLDAHNQAKSAHKAAELVPTMQMEPSIDKMLLEQRAKQEAQGLIVDTPKKQSQESALSTAQTPIDKAKEIGKKQKTTKESSKKQDQPTKSNNKKKTASSLGQGS